MASKLNQKEIDSLSEEYEVVQREAKELDKRKKEIRTILFDFFDSSVGKNKEAVAEANNGFRFTREERIALSLDEEMLKEAVDKAIWSKITIATRRVDEGKLKAAIDKKLIGTKVIRKCTKNSKSYRFNLRKSAGEK